MLPAVAILQCYLTRDTANPVYQVLVPVQKKYKYLVNQVFLPGPLLFSVPLLVPVHGLDLILVSVPFHQKKYSDDLIQGSYDIRGTFDFLEDF